MASLLVQIVIAMGVANLAWSAPFDERADAGETFEAAQNTSGRGPLDVIRGSLSDPRDVDVFRLNVADPTMFSVAVTAQMTGPGANDDLTLFVFDSRGVFEFEDQDSGPGLLPNLAIGDLTGDPGNPLLLAITVFNNRPGQRVSPLSSWFKDPLPAQSGTYQLALTGASFAVIPEPGTALLTLLGLAVLSAHAAPTRRPHPGPPTR